ncbi:hypothetical protein NKOR_05700 [Candidatus Nitrosopumilus koreensis AR1]|uniref:Uncharacterized protein n=1 Tax=Candidatus Nitrosopumilus koreensis AR1 TaxID=1229908 RepID=K0B4D6_9ARCH|nr:MULTISPECIES: hypothetical protein [Nitrosopumilus]AFS81023.1 hypothetical protein NKOR_05700 [Candidatus Nitrosopumilus koreensis AR1]
MNKTYDVKTVVLRKNIDLDEATEIVEDKKTKPFKSLLSRPKKEQIHIHSIKLYYECILMVSGKYIADYYRKATHTISVDSNVKEVELGDGVFQTRPKSVLEKTFVGKKGKNKIDIKLEEHVFVEEEDELTFDHHGREVKFPFKVNSKTVENYPKRILQKNEPNIKRPEMTYDAALESLKSLLKKPLAADVRELSEEFVLRDITEVYVPIFEARLIGPKKKVELMRIDAVRKKIL